MNVSTTHLLMEGARLIDESHDPGNIERSQVATIPPLDTPPDEVL